MAESVIYDNGRLIADFSGDDITGLVGGSSITDGTAQGQVLTWDGSAYAFATPQNVVLTWDGASNYSPSWARALTCPKLFVGPTDPNGLTGVSLNDYDRWINTT